MIALSGKAKEARLSKPLERRVWAITNAHSTRNTPLRKTACILDPNESPNEEFDLYLVRGDASNLDHLENVVSLPEALWYLEVGDCFAISSDGLKLRILWRLASSQNFIFLTERCNHFCIMCSQPPRDVEDSQHLRDAHELLTLLPADTWQLGVTGGEPTLYGLELIDLLERARDLLPNAGVHLLTNGKAFADMGYAAAWAKVKHPDLMAAIPLYSANPMVHDYIVQCDGAFDETVRGIVNLAKFGQLIELRVVIQAANAFHLEELARYIARNLPFVSQVALMGLEVTGFAKANIEEVWVDPDDYAKNLKHAVEILDAAGVRSLIYNHQLCTLPEELWERSVQSISDWKNEYSDACRSCEVLERCGGFFGTSKHKISVAIRPIGNRGEHPLPDGIQFLPTKQP